VDVTEIQPLLEPPARAVENWLRDFVAKTELPESLRRAVSYALLEGGKRLRPTLAWHCCGAVGADPELSLPAGAGVELVHAFSLVHDDLPAMDDDDLRRGKPTLHIHAGEAMAILSGDLMLALAFSALQRAPGKLIKPLTDELSSATTAMIRGQVRDTIPGADDPHDNEQRLRLIHRDKTGALIRAACRMGAMCGLATRPSAGESALDAITRYAEDIGLMFQIVDDLLDVEQTTEQAGKRTGKDQAAGKLTFPHILGVKRSREEIERLRAAGVEALGGLGPEANALRSLAAFLAERSA
jgi:geranylgeranyl diphosphate synthase type II